jgi:hypothetical protein
LVTVVDGQSEIDPIQIRRFSWSTSGPEGIFYNGVGLQRVDIGVGYGPTNVNLDGSLRWCRGYSRCLDMQGGWPRALKPAKEYADAQQIEQ